MCFGRVGAWCAMIYARRSLNYLVSIAIVRRAALLAWPIRSRVRNGLLGTHLRNAERQGLWQYLHLERFTHANTDGPSIPSPGSTTSPR